MEGSRYRNYIVRRVMLAEKDAFAGTIKSRSRDETTAPEGEHTTSE